MIQVYADGATFPELERYATDPKVAGFTTNPSLLAKIGVTNYAEFGRVAAAAVHPKPISFEVLSEDPTQIEWEAHRLQQWGTNVVVKVPIVSSTGASQFAVIHRLRRAGVALNVTAVLTRQDASTARLALEDWTASQPAIVSIFAGRIGDLEQDPCLAFDAARGRRVTLLWASTRSLGDLHRAAQAGAHIITMSPALIDKRAAMQGKSLAQYARETVAQFTADAQASGLTVS